MASKKATAAQAKKDAKAAQKKRDAFLALPDDPTKLRNPEIKPDMKVMRKLAGVYGIDLPKTKGVAVRKLREAITERLKDAAKVPEDDVIHCDVCREFSTEDVDRCPFCGDMGGSPDQAEKAPAKSDDSEPAEKPAEKPTKKKSKKAAAGPTEPPKPAEEAPGTEVVTTEEVALEMARTDLDARVERIQALKRDVAGKGWELGREIFAIFEAELWKARGHASFKAFIESELQIGKSTAYGLMEAASQFSREDFEAVGQSKIVLIAKLPEGQRDKALDAARAGDMSYRDIKKKMVEANRQAGTTTGGAGGGKSKGSKPAAPPPEPASDQPDEDGGFTLLARVDDGPVTVKWRKETTGRLIKHHPRIGLTDGCEDKPDAYAELKLDEASVAIRVALKFDADGWPIGMTFQFVKI